MCTFILAWRVFDDAPLVVAANRDEARDRPSRPPERLATDPEIVAPVDERAGGTWIGHNEFGVLVAVTNRWTDATLDGERSRGLLVRDALERSSARDAAAFVERAVSRHEYDGFNLVLADEDDALLVEWDGTLQETAFEPGVHVVVNVGADDEFEIPAFRSEHATAQANRTRRARANLCPKPGEDVDSWVERAVDVLQDHEYGFCVHEDGYGTRSSSLYRFASDGTVRSEYADGPPCETAYVDVNVPE